MNKRTQKKQRKSNQSNQSSQPKQTPQKTLPLKDPMEELEKIPMIEIDPKLRELMPKAVLPGLDQSELDQMTNQMTNQPPTQETPLSINLQQDQVSLEESPATTTDESPVGEMLDEAFPQPGTTIQTTQINDVVDAEWEEEELLSPPKELSLEEIAEIELSDKIREFCSEHSIAMVMKALCEKVPEALPNYRTWDMPDPIPVIYSLIHLEGYVEERLPVLKVMLRDSVGNISWSARVLIAMAVYKSVEQVGLGRLES